MPGQNTIGDLVVDSLVVRQGFAEMAIATLPAGPLFNMANGLGIGLTNANAKNGDPYRLVFDDAVYSPFVFLGGILFCSLTWIALNRFTAPKAMVAVLVPTYGVFLIIALSAFSVL